MLKAIHWNRRSTFWKVPTSGSKLILILLPYYCNTLYIVPNIIDCFLQGPLSFDGADRIGISAFYQIQSKYPDAHLFNICRIETVRTIFWSTNLGTYKTWVNLKLKSVMKLVQSNIKCLLKLLFIDVSCNGHRANYILHLYFLTPVFSYSEQCQRFSKQSNIYLLVLLVYLNNKFLGSF